MAEISSRRRAVSRMTFGSISPPFTPRPSPGHPTPDADKTAPDQQMEPSRLQTVVPGRYFQKSGEWTRSTGRSLPPGPGGHKGEAGAARVFAGY